MGPVATVIGWRHVRREALVALLTTALRGNRRRRGPRGRPLTISRSRANRRLALHELGPVIEPDSARLLDRGIHAEDDLSAVRQVLDRSGEVLGKLAAVTGDGLERREVDHPGLGILVGDHAAGNRADHSHRGLTQPHAPAYPGVLLVRLAPTHLDEHPEPPVVQPFPAGGHAPQPLDAGRGHQRHRVHVDGGPGRVHRHEVHRLAHELGESG